MMLPLKTKAQQLRPLRGRFVNASAVALLSFLYLLNLTQVRFFSFAAIPRHQILLISILTMVAIL